MTIGPSPDVVFADLNDETFNMWLHQPITAAFFRYLKDQSDDWRAAVLEMWEAGLFSRPVEDGRATPEFLRGQVRAFSDLGEIRLGAIQEFYAAATEATE